MLYINISEIIRIKNRLKDLNLNIKGTLNRVSQEITDINYNIRSTELISSNGNIMAKISNLSTAVDKCLNRLILFMEAQTESYQVTNDEAKASLESLVNQINSTFDSSGKVIVAASTVAAQEASSKSFYDGSSESTGSVSPDVGAVPASADTGANSVYADTGIGVDDSGVGAGVDNAPTAVNTGVSAGVDTSVYTNRPENGFVVTTGNTTYDLSPGDRDLIYGIVAAESDKSYDDALAVASVILNRCEAPNWVASFGTSPVAQATARHQFVVYEQGYYASYINGAAPDTVKRAVDDALNGVRNCNYMSFRSAGTTGYSNNRVTNTGNRYK